MSTPLQKIIVATLAVPVGYLVHQIRVRNELEDLYNLYYRLYHTKEDVSERQRLGSMLEKEIEIQDKFINSSKFSKIYFSPASKSGFKKLNKLLEMYKSE